MGRTQKGYCYIDTTVEVEIDEYLEHATDEALLEEIADRGIENMDQAKIGEDYFLNGLCHKLNLTQEQLLRDFFKGLKS